MAVPADILAPVSALPDVLSPASPWVAVRVMWFLWRRPCGPWQCASLPSLLVTVLACAAGLDVDSWGSDFGMMQRVDRDSEGEVLEWVDETFAKPAAACSRVLAALPSTTPTAAPGCDPGIGVVGSFADTEPSPRTSSRP